MLLGVLTGARAKSFSTLCSARAALRHAAQGEMVGMMPLFLHLLHLLTLASSSAPSLDLTFIKLPPPGRWPHYYDAESVLFINRGKARPPAKPIKWEWFFFFLFGFCFCVALGKHLASPLASVLFPVELSPIRFRTKTGS